jgi:hypothetical protein
MIARPDPYLYLAASQAGSAVPLAFDIQVAALPRLRFRIVLFPQNSEASVCVTKMPNGLPSSWIREARNLFANSQLSMLTIAMVINPSASGLAARRQSHC